MNRLIWGKHERGTAGISEMCAIGDEFGVKHVFFVDMCGAYRYPEEMRQVVCWLDQRGQDVQLHTHPEVLPKSFWTDNGVEYRPEDMNDYSNDAWAEFVISHFSKLISDVTGKDILAYRAGSFRWNACSIRALKAVNIPMSFNNSMRAYREGRCVFSEPTNLPYAWSNGMIEVPVTEKRMPIQPGGRECWTSLTYPEAAYFPFQPERASVISRIFGRGLTFCVFLIHSWSLLSWDENGHATYRDDQRLEGYRKLLARLACDYDIITTRDFLDLYARGKITLSQTVDISKADLKRYA
ncbi:MAG TPA: hypothetical protein PKV55_08180 [Nitrospira sp.]|nr:hypothetical protein [Nitrospira sp.]